jgi:hypothetical protein
MNAKPENLEQTHPPIACAHSVSTVEPTDSTLGPNASERTNKASQQNSLNILDQTSLTRANHCQASQDSTIILPSITLSQTKYRPVSKDVKDLYLNKDTVPTMSNILRNCVKYHKKTANFQDRDCLVTKVLKSINAIIKPPINLTAYFDLVIQNKVKQELKKELAGLKSH